MSSCTTLLRINQFWRNIAMKTPQLWTHLYIHTTSVPAVQFYLKHSDRLPLDVQIELFKHKSLTNTSPLSEILAENLNRIRSLEIHVSVHKYADKLLAQIGLGQPAPILESLYIQVRYNSIPVPNSLSLQSAFQSTPRLRHLNLPAYPLPKPTCPLFSSPDLTDLILDGNPFGTNINENMIFSTIGALKNLQSFTFKSSDNCTYHETSIFPNINTPHLLSVDVSAGWGVDILCAFDAPILTFVRFDAMKQDMSNWTDSYFGPMITLKHLSQRSPLVKQLELCGILLFCRERDYLWLFRTAFPLLEVLKFEGSEVTDEFLALGANSMLNLKALELRRCRGVSGSGLFSFLQARGKGFQLALYECDYIANDTLRALSKVVTLKL